MKKIITHPRLGEITVVRSRQLKRLSVSVRPPGTVRLNIPARESMRSALAFLEEKEDWVAATLQKVARKYPARLLEQGYSTYSHVLEFVRRPDLEKPSYRITDRMITVMIPSDMDYASEAAQHTAEAAVTVTLRSEAKAVLPGMVAEAAARYGFTYGKVSVRASRTRWGSCSGRDDISLSIFLMRLPVHLIWYVVVHELCHTRHKDHSPRFHSLLDSLCEGREKELRRELLRHSTGVH